MVSLRILHASDLHISEFENIRSPIDHFKDLRNPYSFSPSGIVAKIKTLYQLRTHMRQRLASSHSCEPLLALSEFIYVNARRKVRGDGTEIEESGNKVDAVVLTGDLATTGEVEDVEKTRMFLKATYNRRIPYKASEVEYRDATLSALRIPVIVLPGNHDRYEETGRWHRGCPILFNPAGKNFDNLIQNYAAPKKPVYTTSLSAPFDNQNQLSVKVICADFSLQDIEDSDGLLGWLAQGAVYSDIRKRLVDETKRVIAETPKGDVPCILWAIHFPPFFPGIKTHSKLLGEEVLIQLANDLGVHAVLSGHTHVQMQYNLPGMTFQGLCCGTTTQYEPHALPGGHQQGNVRAGNHFQILTITADKNLWANITVRDYRYGAIGAAGEPNVYGWQEAPGPLRLSP